MMIILHLEFVAFLLQSFNMLLSLARKPTTNAMPTFRESILKEAEKEKIFNGNFSIYQEQSTDDGSISESALILDLLDGPKESKIAGGFLDDEEFFAAYENTIPNCFNALTLQKKPAESDESDQIISNSVKPAVTDDLVGKVADHLKRTKEKYRISDDQLIEVLDRFLSTELVIELVVVEPAK